MPKLVRKKNERKKEREVPLLDSTVQFINATATARRLSFSSAFVVAERNVCAPKVQSRMLDTLWDYQREEQTLWGQQEGQWQR